MVNEKRILQSFIGKILAVITISLFTAGGLSASPPGDGRIVVSVNDGWKFKYGGNAFAETSKINDENWERISLPHTWNADDPFDNDYTYKRGIGWYRKTLTLGAKLKDKKIFLVFEGANQVARVYVNGSFAGTHKGGYTAFSIDITSFLRWENGSSHNLIAVEVNNGHDPFIPPLSVGYALYGGIYRDVWLVAVDKTHFSEVNTNSAGVFISTPQVSGDKAAVSIHTVIKNESRVSRTLTFQNIISDASGKQVATISKEIIVAANSEQTISLTGNAIDHPHLWSPENPYLYQVKSSILENGRIIDQVINPLGFRWFRFDPDNGFMLNGKKLILHGTTRHQDTKGKGDALSDEDHERDMKLIREMGCNFVRLAHYPQDPAVLNAADRLGLIIWQEVPVVNYMTLSPEFLANAGTMIREMIHQGYNHPCVAIWGSMNEILLYSKDAARIQHHVDDTVYLRGLKKYAVHLDSIVRTEDPTRYSAMAMHLSNDYSKFGLDDIPQVGGYNIYSGWYGGKVEDFGKQLDRMHSESPDHVIFISEYGAGTDQQLNSEDPQRFDFTGEYQRYFHESYLRQINQRLWLGGTAIWNEFDFSQPNIGGTIPHMNHKGMITWDRKPKDVYYFYKANWNPEPMIYIASRDWLIRAGEKNAPSTIDIYSNIPKVTLYLDGKRMDTKEPNDIRKCSFAVRLHEGKNTVLAVGKLNGKTYNDQVIIEYRTYNPVLPNAGENFDELTVNVGSKAQYFDGAGIIWIEDRPYRKGSFGYIGGRAHYFARGEIIKHTGDVPLYYSFLDSLQGYRADVPDGQYEVTLCFAEPERIGRGERIFDISINGEVVMKDIDLISDYGFAEAIKKTFIIDAKNGEGIKIDFQAKKGVPLLNGISIKKR